MEPWSALTLLMVFGGGIAGAAFGALWAVILCALVVFAGCLIVLAGGSDFVLLQVGLGPIFGPHVGGFGAGLVAAAYAAGIKKNHPGGSAKDILSPLIDTSWDVLLVGGLTALVAHVLQQGLVKIPIVNQTDTIAFNLLITTIFARVAFCKEGVFGSSDSIKQHGLLGTANYSISWAGWQSPWSKLLIQSFGLGTLSVGLAVATKGMLDPMAAAGKISAVGAFVVPLILGWSIALLSLIALMLGSGSLQKVPVWHCPAIIGALAFLMSGVPFVGIVAAVISAVVQEFMARLIYNHGSNHIDPPATAILFCTLVINLLFKPEFMNLAQLFK